MANKKAGGKPAKEMDKAGEPMDSALVKRMQKLIADIGTQKRKGFIYMVSTDGKKDANGRSQTAEGILFAHQASAENAVLNLVDRVGFNPIQKLAMAAHIMSMVDMSAKG
jgi:hypothetical protein